MNKDVMIVDELPEIGEISKEKVIGVGKSAIFYNNSEDAIEYLKGLKKGDFPTKYFVDLKLIGDMEGSETIYNFLKEEGVNLEGFYFTTGNLNRHDREILERTSANYLLKVPLEIFSGNLEKILAGKSIKF